MMLNVHTSFTLCEPNDHIAQLANSGDEILNLRVHVILIATYIDKLGHQFQAT